MRKPCVVVVMGVSGCGKSTVGKALASALGWDFRDGDSFHSQGNIAKMRSGAPLTDDDRWPWLDAIGEWMANRIAADQPAVIACSALKRAYRERLISRAQSGCQGKVEGQILFLHLTGEPGVISARMAARHDHFMPPTMLESQLATLEPPDADENAITLDIAQTPEELVAATLQHIL